MTVSTETIQVSTRFQLVYGYLPPANFKTRNPQSPPQAHTTLANVSQYPSFLDLLARPRMTDQPIGLEGLLLRSARLTCTMTVVLLPVLNGACIVIAGQRHG